jgi:hypothetical protein
MPINEIYYRRNFCNETVKKKNYRLGLVERFNRVYQKYQFKVNDLEEEENRMKSN